MDIPTKAEFVDWKKRFPEQARALDVYTESEMPSFTNAFSINYEEHTINIQSIDPILYIDFEYLTIFKTLKRLNLGSMGEKKNIKLGTNLCKNTSLETLWIDDHLNQIDSFPDDFGLVTPQLKYMHLRGAVSLMGIATKKGMMVRKWSFDNLLELHFGDKLNVSSTDFEWFTNATSLRSLIIYSTTYYRNNFFDIAGRFPSLQYLEIFRSDILLDIPFDSMKKLESLILNNMKLNTFPLWSMENFPSLKYINFSNIRNPLILNLSSYDNDFKDISLHLNSEFKNVFFIDLHNTSIKHVEIYNERKRNDVKFKLRSLNISNDTDIHDDRVNITNNFSFGRGKSFKIDLEELKISGSRFPIEILILPNIKSYHGGFILLDENDEEVTHFHYEVYNIARNYPIERARIYSKLVYDNSITDFYSSEFGNFPPEVDEAAEREEFARRMVAGEDVRDANYEEYLRIIEQQNHDKYDEHAAKYGRSTPYYCVYTKEIFDSNPFDGVTTCPICCDFFLKEEQNPDASNSTEFLYFNVDAEIPINKTVVVCNLTDHDAEIATDNNDDSIIQQRIALHHNNSHLFHLDCLQKTLREQVFRNTNPRCPINNDEFLPE